MQTNYSSGLCMAEIAWMAAVERLDMLLNDAMYGILFRDINMCRTFVDQYFSRRFIARAGIIINTGEDNYLTTANAVDKAHTVLASQFINEAFALRAGLSPEQMGLGHAFEIDPWLEDSFLLEIAQAQLVRQIFDRHPIKWMPPTKYKTGDIFFATCTTRCSTSWVSRPSSASSSSGMFSEAIHTPLLMDRYLALKSARYIFGAAATWAMRSTVEAGRHRRGPRPRGAPQGAALLEEVRRESIWTPSAAPPSHGVPFSEIAKDALAYSKANKLSYRSDLGRMGKAGLVGSANTRRSGSRHRTLSGVLSRRNGLPRINRHRALL